MRPVKTVQPATGNRLYTTPLYAQGDGLFSSATRVMEVDRSNHRALSRRESGHCGDRPTAMGRWASVVEAQGERAGVNQGLVPAVDGRVLVACDGPDFVEGGLISQVDGEQLRLERTDT